MKDRISIGEFAKNLEFGMNGFLTYLKLFYGLDSEDEIPKKDCELLYKEFKG